MTARSFTSPDQLQESVGTHLGFSDWITVDQQRIDLFADATGDHQWIHVDVERAKTESPFGTTIAHGFLLLSLISHLQDEIYRVDAKMAINYGTDRVRFVTPVPSGSEVRLGAALNELERLGENVIQLRIKFSVELRNSQKPSCVAEVIHRYYW